MTDDIKKFPDENEDSNSMEEQNINLPVKPYTDAKDIVRHHLRGMYQNWFLEYALIRDTGARRPAYRRRTQTRAAPNPALHENARRRPFPTKSPISWATPCSTIRMATRLYMMLFVQLGQKDLLVETQGNWGNILTGASAAAGRYIEARLSLFALDTLYKPQSNGMGHELRRPQNANRSLCPPNFRFCLQ